MDGSNKYLFGGFVVIAAVLGMCTGVLMQTGPAEVTVEEVESGPLAVSKWQEIVAIEGSAAAFERLHEITASWPYVDQHNEMHKIGEAIYETYGKEGISKCVADLGFGCYHIFLGLALEEHGSSILNELDEACIASHGERSLGCQHGIGHGILVMLGHDGLDEALDLCQTLTWKGPLGGCKGGVFMEFNYNTVVDHKARELDERGEYYPCTDVAAFAKPSCYYLQSMWWSTRSKRDFSVLAERCEAIPEQEFLVTCYNGVGTLAAREAKNSVPIAKENCSYMPNELGVLQCTRGAALMILNDPEFNDDWEKICEDFQDEDKVACLHSYEII